MSASGGYLLDILPEDEKYVLIQKQTMSRNKKALAKVVKLNIYNGKEKFIKSAPVPYSQFLTDNYGVPRFVASIDDDFQTKLFYSNNVGDKWQTFGDEFSGTFTPISFSSDNKSIYALKSVNGDPSGLYEYNLVTKEETLIFKSKLADPTELVKSNLNEVYGLRIDEDYPSYIYFDPANQETKLHKSLYRTFKGAKIKLTSKTDDGKKVIVHVSSDTNPGSFYLFHTDTMKISELFKTAPWIVPQEMSSVEPFRISSPDGYYLNGFITLPKTKDANLPTVILPHGGPHARDYWGYSSQVQLLTDAGYAVIQVNFRGSTGYGKNFEQAGYSNWGTKIQDDILLATQYAIQQGIADKDKVCIFGASFGGYSALQSAIRYPDIYKCAIGYAGVYDLPLLYNKGDITDISWGGAYLDKTLGTDIEKQKAQSPVFNVGNLKAPVLIIHGEDDDRAPLEHAIRLKDALDKNNHPYQWLVKDKEGHGFYNEANIQEANKKILTFLDKYIGH
jgi:dipeptidyl aminopeptidase/acylaminoacyl peptidase